MTIFRPILTFIFFSICIFAYGQEFLDYSIVSTSGGNTTIRVRARAMTSSGQGISGGLSTDGGASYPWGWGSFLYDSDLGGGYYAYYREFTLPSSTTNIGGEFKICDYDTNNNCTPAGSNFTPDIIAGPLPVEFDKINLLLQRNGSINIQWSTRSEMNNDYFTIERSLNGLGFYSIGEVRGAGNSVAEVFYEFLDEEPLPGISFYRIKQTDYDGKFAYSNVKSVINQGKNRTAITPKNTNGFVTIATNLENYDVFVHTSTGQVVETFIGFSGTQNIDLSRLNLGIYYIEIRSNESQETLKVVKY